MSASIASGFEAAIRPISRTSFMSLNSPKDIVFMIFSSNFWRCFAELRGPPV